MKRGRAEVGEEDAEHTEHDCELPAEHLNSIIPEIVEDAAGWPLTHAQLAQMLWSTNFVDHMLDELTLYPDISVRQRPLCSRRVSAPHFHRLPRVGVPRNP